ncbi:MAG: nuclear transport factor 2 family protein [Burkholderia gladioli]
MSITTIATNPASEATTKVFDHHLGAFAQGLDELMKDYDDRSVIVTPDQSCLGTGEIRGFFKAFLDNAKPAFWEAFKVTSKRTEGEIAYLVWEARPFVSMATDTLLVRDGKILVQTFTAFSA